MKKYKIANIGCDDSNRFDMELTEEELKVVIRLFEENNKIADYGCTPHLYMKTEKMITMITVIMKIYA